MLADRVATSPLPMLVEAVSVALGDDMVGLYLYGSAVSGGFDPDVSDLDLVAVTRCTTDELDLAALDSVHAAIVRDNPAWYDRLEVIYIGQETLRDFRVSKASLAVVSPGESLHLSGPVSDWLQNWYLVRGTGVTLAGEPAAAVFPVITEREFLAAIATYARWLGSRELDSLRPGALAYSVLSMCRALRTLRMRTTCSKQEGARWVQAQRPEWGSLIEDALRCRLARGDLGFDDPVTRAAAVTLVRALASEIDRAAPPRRTRDPRLS